MDEPFSILVQTATHVKHVHGLEVASLWLDEGEHVQRVRGRSQGGQSEDRVHIAAKHKIRIDRTLEEQAPFRFAHFSGEKKTLLRVQTSDERTLGRCGDHFQLIERDDHRFLWGQRFERRVDQLVRFQDDFLGFYRATQKVLHEKQEPSEAQNQQAEPEGDVCDSIQVQERRLEQGQFQWAETVEVRVN